jgi:hypothetical protein
MDQFSHFATPSYHAGYKIISDVPFSDFEGIEIAAFLVIFSANNGIEHSK